jgi:putative Ca2+/H+ antiporter (TMEM165/GDT1 family)
MDVNLKIYLSVIALKSAYFNGMHALIMLESILIPLVTISLAELGDKIQLATLPL